LGVPLGLYISSREKALRSLFLFLVFLQVTILFAFKFKPEFYSLYRYLIAISKLRLGILTEPEQGELELEGSYREP